MVLQNFLSIVSKMNVFQYYPSLFFPYKFMLALWVAYSMISSFPHFLCLIFHLSLSYSKRGYTLDFTISMKLYLMYTPYRLHSSFISQIRDVYIPFCFIVHSKLISQSIEGKIGNILHSILHNRKRVGRFDSK